MENLSEMLKGVSEGMALEVIGWGESYGYQIVRRLSALGFEGMAEGTVYALLVRLAKNRLVHIAKRPSDIGPPRKFYTLNEGGRDELAAFWARWDFLPGRIEALREEGGKRYGREPGNP